MIIAKPRERRKTNNEKKEWIKDKKKNVVDHANSEEKFKPTITADLFP